MQDRLVGLLDGQRLSEELGSARVNRLVRACGHITRVEDERIWKAQRVNDLVENASPRDGISRQFRRQEADLPCLAIDRQLPMLPIVDDASGRLQDLIFANILDRLGSVVLAFEDLHVAKPAGKDGKRGHDRASAEQHAACHYRLLWSSRSRRTALAAGTKVRWVIGNTLLATH